MASQKSKMNCLDCENRKSGFFCDLPEKHLKLLNQHKICRSYQAHQTLFHEDTPSFGVYLIESGNVKIYKSDRHGGQKIVKIASAGDIVGYRSILAGENYGATAETLDTVRVCLIEKKIFNQIISEHPETMRDLLTQLARDLGNSQLQNHHLVHRNIKTRLAELLYLLKLKYGKINSNGSVELSIQLSREEIAELIGSTSESVIRQLSEFKKQGYLTLQGKRIILLDPQSILDAADLE